MKLNLISIILFVKDVSRQKRFYADLLGCKVLESSGDNWLLLDAGGCQIGLHSIGEAYREAADTDWKFDSNTKIVFDTDEDIHVLRQMLVAQQIAMRDIKSFDGYPYVVCDGEDPEGNVFQIRQKKI